MMSLSVIIVNYNVRPFLEGAMLSIFKALDGIDSEVFVVDNGSGDGSVPMVRQRFTQARLIENKENVGFARANNQALQKAQGEFVCLINPDTLVRADTFKVCLEYLQQHPDVGAVGCKILNSDGSLQLSCRRSFPMPWVAFTKMVGLSRLFPKSRLFGRYNLTYLDPDKTAEVEALSGSFMMVRRQTIEEVGYLDEDFFMYGEDLDWCYRIGRAGWKIVYLPQTEIIHYKGQSAREAPFDTFRVFFSAMHLFVKKHFRKGWSFFPRWFIKLGIWVWECFSFLFRLFRKGLAPLVDVGFLQLGLVLAIFIRFGNLDYWPRYRVINIIYTVLWVGCLYVIGAYKKGVYSSARSLGGVLAGLVLNTSFTFFFPQYAFSRQVILVAGVLDGLFLSGWRELLKLFSRIQNVPFLGRMGRNLVRRRALIVGESESGKRILERLQSSHASGYDVVGFLGLEEEDLLSMGNGKVPVLGTLKDLERIAPIHRVQEVIFSPEAVDSHRILSVVANPKNRYLDYKMAPRAQDLVIGRTSIETLEDLPLVDLDYKVYTGTNRFFKRAMDLLVSVAMLPLVIVQFFYIAGHPQYRLRRCMISDGVGRSIRTWQLLKAGRQVTGWLCLAPLYVQILLGRMSLVGTEILPFEASSPARGFKPGITGLVHINKKKGLKEEEKDVYTHYYLRNYSLLLDIEIIWRSLFHA